MCTSTGSEPGCHQSAAAASRLPPALDDKLGRRHLSPETLAHFALAANNATGVALLARSIGSLIPALDLRFGGWLYTGSASKRGDDQPLFVV